MRRREQQKTSIFLSLLSPLDVMCFLAAGKYSFLENQLMFKWFSFCPAALQLHEILVENEFQLMKNRIRSRVLELRFGLHTVLGCQSAVLVANYTL